VTTVCRRGETGGRAPVSVQSYVACLSSKELISFLVTAGPGYWDINPPFARMPYLTVGII